MKTKLKRTLILIAELVPTAIVLVLGLYFIFNHEQIADDYVNSKSDKVVRVTNMLDTSGGTGFFVKAPSGASYILTNAHVCAVAENRSVLIDGSYFANILAIYRDHDLCLISNPKGVTGLKVARSSRNGEDIYVLGHPLLEPYALTKGQLSGDLTLNMFQGFDVPCKGPGYSEVDLEGTFIQLLTGAHTACFRELETHPMTANILPGNSGSPVLNSFGHVVGVAFAAVESGVRSYAIPLEFIKDFLEDK